MSNDDEPLILKYLSGFETSDKKGRRSTGYLKPGSQEELRARAALATLLRGINPVPGLGPENYVFRPISPAIRYALASVFTSDEFCASERTIEFKRARRRGRPAELQTKLAVGEFIYNQTELRGACAENPRKFESVVQEAMVKYSLKRRAVLYAWKLYRSLLNAE
jgi:hypothetical protein